MNRTLYRQLWTMRFEKMLRLEKESLAHYKNLLIESKTLFGESPLQEPLERLIVDEARHAGLVQELTAILDRQL